MKSKIHTFFSPFLSSGSEVEWLERRDCDRYPTKPTRAILFLRKNTSSMATLSKINQIIIKMLLKYEYNYTIHSK